MKQMDKTKRIIQQDGGKPHLYSTTPSQADSSYGRPELTPGSSQHFMRIPGWVLLPLRLFLGVTFVYAGIQKLTDPQYFDSSAAGYIGKQIQAFAIGSPLHVFLLQVALPHASLFGALVAYGEIAIGLSTLLGLLLRPAAFFGLLLNLVFFLSASWHVYPYFYGADIVFVFCWITILVAGPVESWIGAYDTVLVPRILAITAEEWRSGMAQILHILLGVRTTAMSSPEQNQVKSASNIRARQAQTTRRNFLGGLVTGGSGMLILLWLAQNLHLLPQSPSAPTAIRTGVIHHAPTPAPTPTGGHAITIAHVHSVPANSAVTFTIPSNSDPGVLVHLNNGKFVAYDATCTHAGCPVQFDPNSKYLICPCHGAEFDPANAGAVVEGPANAPLASVPISINHATGTISISS
jgi:thiosulfate dehydrogenase [quinone] large subunit